MQSADLRGGESCSLLCKYDTILETEQFWDVAFQVRMEEQGGSCWEGSLY